MKGGCLPSPLFCPIHTGRLGNQTKPEGSKSVHFCAVILQETDEYYA